MRTMVDAALLQKYNIPVPRYTSYPTVPNWNDHIDTNAWLNTFSADFDAENGKNGISLYIHLPFCESLCTYCGCNKKITTNHSVEEEYIAAVLSEWNLYRGIMHEKPIIRELHLGGGTPTFFSTIHLRQLINGILDSTIIHPDHEFSFEGHPNNTTEEHLRTLYELGFRRVSFGVQDNDRTVQHIINRIQPFANVQRVTRLARAIGYKSVNFDLIYGLPKQTPHSIARTILQCISLKPDRIAFYSYAHVPWTSRGQRLFDERDLPSPDDKMKLYHIGKSIFQANGYYDIGMDHFALPHDDLYRASKAGTLHRNFMGYTTQQSNIVLGLGVSAISSTPTAFAQNDKQLHNYYQHILMEQPAVQKGYFLTARDRRFARYILNISCNGGTVYQPEDLEEITDYCIPRLESLQADGLVILTDDGVEVTKQGRNFIRNVCSAFDRYLPEAAGENKRNTFSKAI